MKRNLYIFLALIVLCAGLLSSCTKDSQDPVTPNPTVDATPQPTVSETSKSPITFIFLENEINNFSSLYHQLAYIKMENTGYSVSNIYVNESSDLSSILSSIETDGAKYVVITSSILNEQAVIYQQNSSSEMTFIQYGDYYLDTMFSYKEKLYEYYYLAGAALCSQSTSKVAGFLADSPDEEHIRCINAFALGMKSVDEDAIVIVSWAESADDENHIAQLVENFSYQQCDVFAYFMKGDLAETVFDKAGGYYMTMSTHTMLSSTENLSIKPVINLDVYFTDIIDMNKMPLSNEFTYLSAAQQVIGFELSQTASVDAKSAVDDAYQNMQNGFNVFSGPIYNEIGLIVPEGTTLPDADILDMLWFVDNVVGELPAG